MKECVCVALSLCVCAEGVDRETSRVFIKDKLWLNHRIRERLSLSSTNMIIQTATFPPQMRNIEGNVAEKQEGNDELESKRWMEKPIRANETERGSGGDKDGHVFICLLFVLKQAEGTNMSCIQKKLLLDCQKACFINIYCICVVWHTTSGRQLDLYISQYLNIFNYQHRLISSVWTIKCRKKDFYIDSIRTFILTAVRMPALFDCEQYYNRCTESCFRMNKSVYFTG